MHDASAAPGCGYPAPIPQSNLQSFTQSPYLTNNWRALLASEDYIQPEHRYVKVRQISTGGSALNVATIMNGRRGAVIRCAVPLPEGYYAINIRNEFVPLDYDTSYALFSQSKDEEMLRPQFQYLDATPPFPKEECARFIDFLNHIRQENKNHLVMVAHDAAYMVHKNDLWYKFPFALPVKGDGQVFEAYNLKLAFTEMLRYDYVFIHRDNRSPTGNMPLIIGLDWAHCAMVMNRSGW